MLWEENPELLVDDDETKTNNTNFVNFVSLMKKNQQVYFAKNVTAICVIVALMTIIISN